MSLLKRQAVGIIAATILTFAAVWLFGIISVSSMAVYGANAKEAAAIITATLLNRYVPVLLVSAVVFFLLGLSEQKFVYFLYLLCGIASCAATLVVCKSSLSFYGVVPEVWAICETAVKSMPLAYGITFPLLHTLLCILGRGESIMEATINQVLSTGAFLVLFLLFSIVVRYSELSFAKITVMACAAVAAIIAPALNLDKIKQGLKKR